jgi:hypothetical protein
VLADVEPGQRADPVHAAGEAQRLVVGRLEVAPGCTASPMKSAVVLRLELVGDDAAALLSMKRSLPPWCSQPPSGPTRPMNSEGKLPKIWTLAQVRRAAFLNSSSARVVARASGSRPGSVSRPPRLKGLRTPPGTAQAGGSFAAEHLDDLLAELPQADAGAGQVSGSAAIRPKTLRLAGSVSQPSRKSGALRWKKLSAWTADLAEVHQPAQLVGRGRDAHGQDGVAGLGRGQQVADRADAADAGVMPGIS